MGIVYEAYDHERDCRVALKTLRQLTPETLTRFKREFRAVQGIHHPNLVRLGELIANGDEWFFTMELVEGDDFLSYVRPIDSSPLRSLLKFNPRAREAPSDTADLEFDEAKLRTSLCQLAEGLAALHAAGIVHRDVKPSNVRIEHTGRLVLLDFGLIAELDGRTPTSNHRMVGTLEYMAPEQGDESAVGPEADLYSVGAVLFEALTGRAAFEGRGIEVLVGKRENDAPRPSEVTPDVPSDLDDLCAQLLHRDPAERPSATQVVRWLHAPSSAPSARTRSSNPPPIGHPHAAPAFVGRGEELALLEGALGDVRSGKAVSVLVQGESGVGKSALVRHFLERRARDPGVCVLSGPCYEREAVPYKAFDGVIDALVRFLMRLSDEAARALLPTKPGPLVQVFPVLRRVPAMAALTTTALPAMDPLELRDRAFAVLRELLARLAAQYRTIIAIDDAQWADSDSIGLLIEVLHPPDAPNLLLLATVRTAVASAVATQPQSASANELTRDLHAAIPGDVRLMNLERLPHAQACELARCILERSGGLDFVSAAWVAEEADGHPLFIDALARYSVSHTVRDERAVIRLDEVLGAPIRRLQPSERRVLELLAISSGPVAEDILAIAAQLEPDPFARAMAVLRAGHLVTTGGAHRSDLVVLYHDRIRVAVKQRIFRNERPDLHKRLATALETGGSGDAQALAAHWYGAGDTKQATRYARMAADHATHALAFERAATLYDWTLRLDTGTEEERRELYEQLGNALASAGRGARAAQAFRRAAKTANAAKALDLQRRAADQLLRAGHFDQGLDAMRGVLTAIGMKLPETRVATLATFLFWLALLRVRGLWFRRRDPSQIAAHQLTQIDTCWSVAFGLSITDTVRGAAFHNRALFLSLRAGEPHRVARALALHAGFTATRGGRWSRARAHKLLARSHQLAEASNDPHALGWAKGAACAVHYLTGNFKRAVEQFADAERIWRETPGTSWELDTIKVFAINSIAQLGRLRDLCTRTPKYLRETIERGDLYGAVNLRVGYANFRWLVEGRVDDARRELDEAMAQWSKQGFHLEHFYELLARTNLALYEGTTAAGLAQVHASWSGIDRALLFRVQPLRVLARFMRGRLALAQGVERGAEGRTNIEIARKDARAIARERVAWGEPLADLLRAGCALAGGDDGHARSALAKAVRGFAASDMELHRVVAAAAYGRLVGGDEGAREAADAAAWMKSQGVVDPPALARTIGPGLPEWT
jgi:tetratricopeptide (TPR) repeat protein